MKNADIAIIISLGALIISFLSLWINSLTPFRLRVMNDPPTFSVYKVPPQISGDREGKTWWIPSFDVGISFFNLGRRPGVVKDVRLVAVFKGYRTNKKYVFYPNWIVDYPKFCETKPDRFKWIDKAVVREWYPILLGSQKESHVHLILESDRWDQKESGSFEISFEVATGKKWRVYQKYSLHFDDSIFETNETYTAYCGEIERLRES
jgi:hypothetical protein